MRVNDAGHAPPSGASLWTRLVRIIVGFTSFYPTYRLINNGLLQTHYILCHCEEIATKQSRILRRDRRACAQ